MTTVKPTAKDFTGDKENEIWMDMKGYEGHYEVSNLGRVKSKKRSVHRLLENTKDMDGYERVKLTMFRKKKTVPVHRLMCIAFLSNPENKPCVNHINGIKADNRLENLEWCTVKENNIHAVKNRLINPRIGINHMMSKVSNDDVIFIRDKDISIRQLSKAFNLSEASIRDIKQRKTWKHLN